RDTSPQADVSWSVSSRFRAAIADASCYPWFISLAAGNRSHSAATDLAWRPRARDEAARSRRFPRLMGLGLCCWWGRGGGRVGRLLSAFRRRLGLRDSRLCLVLLQTAMFVFASGTAMTAFVSP